MNVNIVLQIIANKEINILKISKTRNSLFKILILEINDKCILFFEVLKDILNFGLQDQYFLLNY